MKDVSTGANRENRDRIDIFSVSCSSAWFILLRREGSGSHKNPIIAASDGRRRKVQPWSEEFRGFFCTNPFCFICISCHSISGSARMAKSRQRLADEAKSTLPSNRERLARGNKLGRVQHETSELDRRTTRRTTDWICVRSAGVPKAAGWWPLARSRASNGFWKGER